MVLADEPTAALDKDSAADVIDLLKRLGAARGTTTLLVTHDNRILDRADRILTLEDGRIVSSDVGPAAPRVDHGEGSGAPSSRRGV